MKTVLYFLFLIFSIHSNIKVIKNDETKKDRELWPFGFGPYNPLFNPTLSMYAGMHHPATHAAIASATTAHLMNPYLGLGHFNPYMTNPYFFGFNPLYS